ncbi:MAG TPA: glutamate-1-semialdehyde 2,1-aminomutase [Candidatus Saccharimonadales bacterium]|nr:glutamate-1-semialdehyde 2,1-aminomutase [Candidatus Saccharimonadales bacterium]
MNPSIPRSEDLFARATGLMPGGVNSPVRAFRAVGGTPRFMERGEGPYLFDVDGHRYTDYVLAWGPLLLGHGDPGVVRAVAEQAARGVVFGAPTEGEVQLAAALRRLVPSLERVRLVNSGTEAAISALRLARAATGRDLVLKFDGCYHGHGDSFLVRAGSGAATLDVPDSPGVPAALAAMTRVARYNDLGSVEAAFAARPGQIAAVFVEPVVGNYGVLPPRPGFLEGLRAACDREGALLVFDEVMTGFRVARGGAQAHYRIRPDLTLLGKVIGGGLPIGAYGGRADLMDRVAPSGPVYQAGTNSGNPVAVAAGLAALARVEREPVCERAAALAAELAEGLREAAAGAGVEATVNQVGSMWSLFFASGPVDDLAGVGRADRAKFARFHAAMLARGVYLPPSPFEAAFLSAAHTEKDIQATVGAARAALAEVREGA